MIENAPNIGLICIGLKGERLDLAEQFLKEAKHTLNDEGITIVNAPDTCILSGVDAAREVHKCEHSGASCIVFLIGTWVLANHIIDAVQQTSLPIGVWGIPEAASFSSVGASVVHGAMEEMGIKHRLFYGMPSDKNVLREIKAFARASDAIRRMRGARFGLLGGRTINAYPTTSDHNQIKRIFGIEVEHIDQLVLLERARNIPVEKAREVCCYVKDTYGAVNVPEDILIKSANVFLALQQIREEYCFDFCSVKCIGEFMDTYTSCCMAVALMNDLGFLVGCQASVNAGISSYLLSLLSGGPVFFGDVNVVDVKDRTARLINCGAIPTKLANSYKEVTWETQYEYMGAGRGACTLFCCKPGPVTFGTLGRKEGRYVMTIAEGEAFMKPVEELTQVRTWAQGFVRLHCDPVKFYHNILSNHSVMGYGRLTPELLEFCRLKDILPLTNE